jgi:hypothetical protein
MRPRVSELLQSSLPDPDRDEPQVDNLLPVGLSGIVNESRHCYYLGEGGIFHLWGQSFGMSLGT